MNGVRIAGWVRALGVGAVVGIGGCELPRAADAEPRAALPRDLDRGPLAGNRGRPATPPRADILPASHTEIPDAVATPAGVDDLIAFAVARNPRLSKATFAVDAARGRHIQAGLYPNPDLAINWDEIGDRTGPGGIITAPKLTQPIVTGRKLSLAQAVAAAEVDQATLALLGERYAVVSSVRAAYYDAYTLERRIEALDELVRLADDAVQNGKKLLDNQKIARLDLVQLEVERERFRAEAEAVKRELPAARRALAAAVGDPRMPVGPLAGAFDSLPTYDADRSLELILATHPEVRSARVGVERAQAAVRRAQAEVIPNVNVSTGYIRQYENKSHDFALGFNGAIPVWNRNQGGIRAAQAELGMATQEVGRVENDLADRVATAFRAYAASLRRAEVYRTGILPKARETYELSLEAFKGGQFEYLRVILAQRAVAEAKLEYNKALGDAWKGAAQLSGLLLEESWPDPPRTPEVKPAPPREPDPKPAPAPLPTPPTGKPGG
jgi:cobalt-zinc-cadmium efflux system outer membrane protein